MSFGEYAAFLRRSIEKVPLELETVSAVVAENAAIEARSMIGVKQPGWEDLTESTKASKGKLGFAPPDFNPLLRSGSMRDSIRFISTSMGGVIGSDDKTLVYHEMGTSKMVARPLLGQALMRTMPLLEQMLGESAEMLLTPIKR